MSLTPCSSKQSNVSVGYTSQMLIPFLVLHPGAAVTTVLFSTHLTDDEHVLPPDDALLHLGAQSLPNVHLIAVAVRSVYVAVSSSNGSLYCTLD